MAIVRVRPVHAVSSLLVGASLVLSSVAFAQGTPASPSARGATSSSPPVAAISQVDGHDVYDFPDDSLLGEGLDGHVIRIPTRAQAARASLVRPRLSFVPELLSAAEDL